MFQIIWIKFSLRRHFHVIENRRMRQINRHIDSSFSSYFIWILRPLNKVTRQNTDFANYFTNNSESDDSDDDNDIMALIIMTTMRLIVITMVMYTWDDNDELSLRLGRSVLISCSAYIAVMHKLDCLTERAVQWCKLHKTETSFFAPAVGIAP